MYVGLHITRKEPATHLRKARAAHINIEPSVPGPLVSARTGGQPCPITLHADGLRGCHPTPACGRHSTGQTFLDTALVAGDGQYLVEEGLEDLLLQLGRIAEMDAIGTQPLACCAVAVGAQPI